MDPQLDEMIRAYLASQPEDATSEYWTRLNARNVQQLLLHGYGSFKQTVNRNYSMSLARPTDPQVRFLMRNLGVPQVLLAFGRALLARRHAHLTAKQSILHNFVTFMLWEYAIRDGDQDALAQSEEPLEGGPAFVTLPGGKRVSQDLVHSAREYQAISNGIGDLRQVSSMMELGAGYGRTSFVFLH